MKPTPSRMYQNLRQAMGLVWRSAPGWTLASVGLLFVQSVLPLLTLYLVKLIVDAVTAAINSPDPLVALKPVLLLLGLAAATALLGDACRSLAAMASAAQSEAVQDYVHDMLHAKSIEVDLDYYENAQYHNVLHRAQQQAAFLPQRVLVDLVQLGQNGLSLLAMAGLLVTLHWGIAAVLLLAAVPGLLVRLKFAGKLYWRQREWTTPERQAGYYHWLLTSLSVAKEVRLLELGKLFCERFRNLRRQVREDKLKLATQRSVAELISQVSATLAIFGALGFVAYKAIVKAITIGGLVMYYQAFQRGQVYLREMLASLARLYENSLFLSDFSEFLDFKRSVPEPAQPKPMPRPLSRGIEFEHVRFAYPHSNQAVLEDVNLTVRAGETVALVGENGAGKTTLVKLLCRLYDPAHGRITMDGIDLRELSTTELRREISVLFQDYVRYNVTARENIGFGNVHPWPSQEQIVEAASFSDAHHAITRLSHGYETVLGKQYEEGAELSIGEWQKVALARVYCRRAQIVVLDEPTGALDPHAEHDLLGRFRRLTEGRTSIIISHRLSTVRFADRILVLHGGRIIEQGPHDELMRRGGFYARLFEAQAGHYR